MANCFSSLSLSCFKLFPSKLSHDHMIMGQRDSDNLSLYMHFETDLSGSGADILEVGTRQCVVTFFFSVLSNRANRTKGRKVS